MLCAYLWRVWRAESSPSAEARELGVLGISRGLKQTQLEIQPYSVSELTLWKSRSSVAGMWFTVTPRSSTVSLYKFCCCAAGMWFTVTPRSPTATLYKFCCCAAGMWFTVTPRSPTATLYKFCCCAAGMWFTVTPAPTSVRSARCQSSVGWSTFRFKVKYL